MSDTVQAPGMPVGGAVIRTGSLVVPTIAFAVYLTHAAAAAFLLVAGCRVYALTAGFTAQAASAAVTAFACAAAFGTVFTGVRARRISGPMGLLAVAQAGFGLITVLSILVFRAARTAYLALWPMLGEPAAGTFALRLALGLALFALPTAIYCASPPLLGRLVTSRPEGVGLSLGFSFGLSLAGSALGLGVAGSLVMPALGLRGTVLLGLALSGLAAAGTVLLRQRGVEGPGIVGAILAGDDIRSWEPGPSEPTEATTTEAAGALGAAMALFAFTAWGLLLIYDRTLSFVIGRSLDARATSAAVFLLALALGVFLSSALTDILSGPFVALAVAMGAASVAAYLSMYLVAQVAQLYLRLLPSLGHPGWSLLQDALVSAALMFPAVLLLGAALPLLAQAARARRRSAIGVITYIALGIVLADLAVGLLMIPVFGLRRAMGCVSAVGLWAAILFLLFARFRQRALRTTVALVLIGLVVIFIGWPATWDPRVVAAGLYRYGARALTRYGSVEGYLAARRGTEVLFYKEGADSSVMVERTLQAAPGAAPVEGLSLTVDGKVEGATGDDIRTQVLQAHIPILVHGPTDSVLLIDLLNGVTAGSLLRHPVKSLTVLEREPVLFEASQFFSSYNYSPAQDSRLVRIKDAARARLLVDPSTYDVIIVAGIDPWLPQSASLITTEGMSLLKRRLKRGGLLALRVPVASAGEPALRAVMRTFAGAFDSILLFRISSEDLLLLGSAEPLQLDVGWMRNVISSSGEVSHDLRRITVISPNEILYTFRLAGNDLRRVLGEGPGNDDDRSAVEFASMRDLTVHGNEPFLAALEAAGSSIVPHLANYGALPEEKADFLYNLAKSYLGIAGDPVRGKDLARELQALGQTVKSRWVMGECLLQQSDIDGALGEWRGVLELDPGNLDALFSLGTYYMDSHDYWKADPYLEKANRQYGDASVVRYNYGRNLYYLGRHPQAIDELKEARRIAREKEKRDDYPLVDYLIGVSSHKIKKDKEAAESLETYLKWAYTQPLTRLEVDAHIKLAEAYDNLGKRFQAHKERQKGEDLLRRLQGQSFEPAPPPTGGAGESPGDPGAATDAS